MRGSCVSAERDIDEEYVPEKSSTPQTFGGERDQWRTWKRKDDVADFMGRRSVGMLKLLQPIAMNGDTPVDSSMTWKWLVFCEDVLEDNVQVWHLNVFLGRLAPASLSVMASATCAGSHVATHGAKQASCTSTTDQVSIALSGCTDDEGTNTRCLRLLRKCGTVWASQSQA